jgi:hypothetical protein
MNLFVKFSGIHSTLIFLRATFDMNRAYEYEHNGHNYSQNPI